MELGSSIHSIAAPMSFILAGAGRHSLQSSLDALRVRARLSYKSWDTNCEGLLTNSNLSSLITYWLVCVICINLERSDYDEAPLCSQVHCYNICASCKRFPYYSVELISALLFSKHNFNLEQST